MKKIDTQKDEIIHEFINNLDNEDFKGTKIQAGPGTGKTTLLVGLIDKLDDKKSAIVISHMNSAIDNIENKLRSLDIFNSKAITISSFLLEYFLFPICFPLSNDAKTLNAIELSAKSKSININKTEIRNFLNKINTELLESEIQNKERRVFENTLEILSTVDSYIGIFINLLRNSGIRIIGIDEYFDTNPFFIKIFENISRFTNIKLLLIGDENQYIGYNPNIFSIENTGFINHTLTKTYRFPKAVLDASNSIIQSGITDCEQTEGVVIEFQESPGQFILENTDYFKNKSTMIILHPANYNKRHKDVVESLKKLCRDNGFKYKYFEKEVCNYNLKKVFGNIKDFILGKSDMIYSKSVEKFLTSTFKLSESDKKNVFRQLISINKNISISEFGIILSKIFQIYEFKENHVRDNSNKQAFTAISEGLEKIHGKSLNEFNEHSVQEILDSSLDSETCFMINTIHSAKGREYENVIVLDRISESGNKYEYFSNLLNEEYQHEKKELYKRFLYVAYTRTKKNLFIHKSKYRE